MSDTLRILAHLRAAERSMTVHELARRLDIGADIVTRALKLLVACGPARLDVDDRTRYTWNGWPDHPSEPGHFHVYGRFDGRTVLYGVSQYWWTCALCGSSTNSGPQAMDAYCVRCLKQPMVRDVPGLRCPACAWQQVVEDAGDDEGDVFHGVDPNVKIGDAHSDLRGKPERFGELSEAV